MILLDPVLTSTFHPPASQNSQRTSPANRRARKSKFFINGISFSRANICMFRPKEAQKSRFTTAISPEANTIDSSVVYSPADATLGNTDDFDSSIELVAKQRPSPLTAALKHVALAQANFLEHIARRDEREQIENSMASSEYILPPSLQRSTPLSPRVILNQPTSSFRPPFSDHLKKQSQTGLHAQRRNFISTSTAEAEENESIDWDDPVLLGTAQPDTDGSDLPDMDFVGHPSRQVITKQPSTSTSKRTPKENIILQQKTGALPQAAFSEKLALNPIASKHPSSAAEIHRLRAEARRLAEAAKLARETEKAKNIERLKAKYSQFSYDKGSWVTPKVWYYRGTSDGTEFLNCDVRAGTNPPENKTLEEVVAMLEG